MVQPLVPILLSLLAMQDTAAEKLPLKILYAGNAGTPYSAAWARFLGEHATEVKAVVGGELTAADLAGFDLLVIDGEVEAKSASGQVQLKSEKIALTLADLQGVPVVLMGGQGGFLSDELKLKTSWQHG